MAGPGESLTREIGNVCQRVVLGGDGEYTPHAEMIDCSRAVTSGPDRVRTSAMPSRTPNLFLALILAEEAARVIGEPQPPAQRGRKQTA